MSYEGAGNIVCHCFLLFTLDCYAAVLIVSAWSLIGCIVVCYCAYEHVRLSCALNKAAYLLARDLRFAQKTVGGRRVGNYRYS